jgi:uncharacterized membrane protein YphA (DoxX/SURF4 family)
MKSTTLKTSAYWLTTGLLALDFTVGGAFQIACPPQVMNAMTHFGYPAYFVTLLGVWKVLGGLALLVPGYPRLKEWAYAGIFFDVTSAVVSILAVGDGLASASLPLVFLALTVASWALRPASRAFVSVASRTSTSSLRASAARATA